MAKTTTYKRKKNQNIHGVCIKTGKMTVTIKTIYNQMAFRVLLRRDWFIDAQQSKQKKKKPLVSRQLFSPITDKSESFALEDGST